MSKLQVVTELSTGRCSDGLEQRRRCSEIKVAKKSRCIEVLWGRIYYRHFDPIKVWGVTARLEGAKLVLHFTSTGKGNFSKLTTIVPTSFHGTLVEVLCIMQALARKNMIKCGNGYT